MQKKIYGLKRKKWLFTKSLKNIIRCSTESCDAESMVRCFSAVNVNVNISMYVQSLYMVYYRAARCSTVRWVIVNSEGCGVK